MSEATGLGPLEVAILSTVQALTSRHRWARTDHVLDHFEQHHDLGGRYAAVAIQDLGVDWQTHLHVLDLDGNWGFGWSNPMADPQYTLVGLNDLGRLALAAERGDTGAVPIGLINGSVYRGGRIPPLDPLPTLAAVAAMVEHTDRGGDLAELVQLPGGGVVLDGLPELVAGRPTRVVCSSRIERTHITGQPALIITGVPPFHDAEQVQEFIQQRVWASRRRRTVVEDSEDPFVEEPERPADGPASIVDVSDETKDRHGTRIVITLSNDANTGTVEQWARSLWPVTVVADWHYPGGLAARLTTWADRCRPDPTGLHALQDMLT